MKPSPSKMNNSPHLLAIAALCLAATTPLAQAAGDSSDGARSFLSDPQRVGSLTGTILGGALTAHPIGTLAGSIIGFFIGKETMHKDPGHQQLGQSSYAQRSFIPTTTKETATPMLALKTSTPATKTTVPPMAKVTAPVAVTSLSPLPAMNIDLPSAETLAFAVDPVSTPKMTSPLEQIASLCYGNGGQNKANSPDLQSLCYYHQSS